MIILRGEWMPWYEICRGATDESKHWAAKWMYRSVNRNSEKEGQGNANASGAKQLEDGEEQERSATVFSAHEEEEADSHSKCDAAARLSTSRSPPPRWRRICPESINSCTTENKFKLLLLISIPVLRSVQNTDGCIQNTLSESKGAFWIIWKNFTR